MPLKTLNTSERSKPIPVPRAVATCPICDADIVVEEVHEWECGGQAGGDLSRVRHGAGHRLRRMASLVSGPLVDAVC